MSCIFCTSVSCCKAIRSSTGVGKVDKLKMNLCKCFASRSCNECQDIWLSLTLSTRVCGAERAKRTRTSPPSLKCKRCVTTGLMQESLSSGTHRRWWLCHRIGRVQECRWWRRWGRRCAPGTPQRRQTARLAARRSGTAPPQGPAGARWDICRAKSARDGES